MEGGLGNDSLLGEDGNDRLLGEGGNDTLTGGLGSDTLIGGAGNDLIFGGSETDLVQFTNGWGNDTTQGGESAGDFDHLDFFTVTSNLTVTFSGSEAGTVTDGTNAVAFSEFERFTLGSGADLVDGSAVAAMFHAEAAGGNDTVLGGSGNDTLYGGDGADSLSGGMGDDRMFGDAGSDTLLGGAGADSLFGGDGDDRLTGGAGADSLSGGLGNDTAVFTGAVAEYSFARGPSGELIVTDLFPGRDGVDTLTGIEFASFGGVTYRLLTGDETDNQTLQGPNDGTPVLIIAYGGADWGGGHATNDVMFGGDGSDTLEGGAGNDSLFGGAGDDRLNGGAGADSLDDGAGNDMLDYTNASGGVFVDIDSGFTALAASGDTIAGFEGLTGSAFNDTLQGRAQGDTLIGGAGDDSIRARGGNDTVAGGDGNDLLEGNEGNDLLSGGAGNDLLDGGSGNDSLTGGTGADTFVLHSSGGDDLVTDFDMTLIGGQTIDQLDVSSLQNPDASPVRSWDVTVSTGPAGETLLIFPEGETLLLQGVDPASVSVPGMLHAMGVPCLVAGTRILTPQGPRRVERLQVGDLVCLAGGGAAPLLWVGARRISAAEIAARPALRPVRIRAGSHGALRDLLVSPQHAVRVGLEPGAALVRAGHLARLDWGARQAQSIRDVSYHHLLLPRHAILLAEGVPVESLYPGRLSISAFLPEVRHDLLSVLRGHCRPGPGQTPAEAYGPRCLPLLGFAAARALRRQGPTLLTDSGNHRRSLSIVPAL